MCFAPVVVRRVDRMCDTSKLPATVNFQCDHLLGEWGPTQTLSCRRRITGIAQDNPARAAYRPCRGMLGLAIWSQRGDQSIAEVSV